MSYVVWALIAMVAYGVTSFLLKVAFKQFPPEVALIVTNTILVLSGITVVIFKSDGFVQYFGMNRPTLWLIVAGFSLSLAIISFYNALSKGPASIVAPIFAMNFAVTALLGFAFLGEGIKITKVLGIVMAGVALVLLTR